MKSDETGQNEITAEVKLPVDEADYSRASGVDAKEVDDLDRRILDLLRIINWRRIERTLAVGRPVTAGVGVIFALCLASADICYGVLYFREAVPSADVLAAVAAGYFGLFLVLIAYRSLILAQLGTLAEQTGGCLGKNIDASRARKFTDDAREYYARHDNAREMGTLLGLLARLASLQSRRTSLEAKSDLTTPGYRLPEPAMCHVGMDDPLELLSVRRENGQLTVRARSTEAFRM